MIQFRKGLGGSSLDVSVLVATKAGSIMGPIASIFGYIMDFLFRITSSMGIMNIGLCIILFTIITKLLLFPLTIKQQESSKLMSLMNPEIKAVQNKYRGKTDQASMARQQVEMQAIYEKYGSNPMAGCLPMAIQLPIIFALYRVIYNIPAYVPSVRVFFDNVANPLMQQADYVNKISELASSVGLGNADFSIESKVVDMLYKLTPAGWETLQGLFPQISSTIADNASKIEQMNYFFGINLATPPFTGFTNISVAWLIPILAGLTQWGSTRLISNLQQVDQDAPGASMMNSMMITMPLMSVFFCFSLPSAIGIYWVVQGAFQLVQQLVVNAHMNKIDVDDLIRRNVEKMNKKRARKGLPPANVSDKASINLKGLQARENAENQAKEDKISRNKKQMEVSESFYNSEPKPGSLAAKAKMVQKYNDKHAKK